MAVILAAFENAASASATLANLTNTVFADLLARPGRGRRLLAFCASSEELERLRAAFPTIKTTRTDRLLDNTEGGVRGGLFGILVGAGLIQLIGFGLYLLGRGQAVGPETGDALDSSSAGALVLLFMGFFGALSGGVVGFLLGRKWLGLPPALARQYERRLRHGELVLAVNQRRLVLDRPRRLRLRPATGRAWLERFYFWLGEHGARATGRAAGSIAALKVTPNPYRRAFDGEDEEEADEL